MSLFRHLYLLFRPSTPLYLSFIPHTQFLHPSRLCWPSCVFRQHRLAFSILRLRLLGSAPKSLTARTSLVSSNLSWACLLRYNVICFSLFLYPWGNFGFSCRVRRTSCAYGLVVALHCIHNYLLSAPLILLPMDLVDHIACKPWRAIWSHVTSWRLWKFNLPMWGCLLLDHVLILLSKSTLPCLFTCTLPKFARSSSTLPISSCSSRSLFNFYCSFNPLLLQSILTTSIDLQHHQNIPQNVCLGNHRYGCSPSRRWWCSW